MIPTNRWLLATAFVALVACTAAELAERPEPHHGDADRNDATLRRELESVTEVRQISVHHGIPPLELYWAWAQSPTHSMILDRF